MAHRGNPSVLLGMKDGRTLELLGGGGQSCTFGLGFKTRLAEDGLIHSKATVGVSGGACNAAAALSTGSDWRALRRFLELYRYIAEGGYFKIRYDRWGPYLGFDVAELVAGLEGKRAHLGLPSLDESAIQARQQPFWVAVTHSKNAEGRLKNAKNRLFKALRASMSVPGSCDATEVDDDELFYDGAWGAPLPGSAIRQFWARKVLIVLNQPPADEYNAWNIYDAWNICYDYAFATVANIRIPIPLRDGTWRMNESILTVIRRLAQCQRLEVLIVYPDRGHSISQVTSNTSLLKRSFEHGQEVGDRLIKLAHAY